MAKGKILVVDDEASMVEFLGNMLKEDGYEVRTATEGGKAIEMAKAQPPNVIIADIRMSPVNGMEVLHQAKQTNPEVNVVMITAFGSIKGAVQAMKEGAFDYITKPFKINEIRSVIRRALSTKRLIGEDEHLRKELKKRYKFSNIIGKSEKMQHIYEVIEKLAKSFSTVLIYGESGTGKELAARAIHYNSPRADNPFVSVNCGALPEPLLESELFGHEKGAFTGAVSTKEGLFEVADGGTFFLDEVGETSPAIQVKLLRALQEREIKRVGGIKNIKVDVRLIAATSKDLEKEIKEGKFREDLFYRLSVIPIYMPPLRERREDVPLLADHFLARYTQREVKQIKGISPQAMERLSQYTWPGNVRELENAIERAVTLAEGDVISSGELPEKISQETPAAGAEEGSTLKVRTDEYEKGLILEALKATGGNVSQAARSLKLTRQDLQYKIKKYGLRGEAQDLWGQTG